jgi:predicted metal-dependent peptidase
MVDIKKLLDEKEIEDRPKYIAKMATYLQDKEPLIYLFIINSDFVEVGESMGTSFAGVLTHKGRVKFLYNDAMLRKLSVEELYFLIIHEAFHIFKKHLEKDEDIFEEDQTLANIATDTIINEEIIRSLSNSSQIKPKTIKGSCLFSDDFKLDHRDIPEDTITSKRFFYYYKNKKFDFKSLLKLGSYVKVKDEETYGRIRREEEGSFSIQVKSKEQVFQEMTGTESDSPSQDGEHIQKKEDELIPIISNIPIKNASPFNGKTDSETEAIVIQADEHFQENGKEEKDLNNLEMDTKTFTEKLLKQAKEIEENFKSEKVAGTGTGAYTKALEGILKPKVNWRKELRKSLNEFITQEECIPLKTKSFITYPWNPRSNYGILCKHFIEQTSNSSSYVVVAVDTSGSIFRNQYELTMFFSEIDAMAKWLNFSKAGNVLMLQWDTQIKSPMKKYKHGDWKKFSKSGIYGGGGTDPMCVFKYFTEEYQKKGSGYFVNNDVKFFIPDKKRLPFIIFLTDGYFFDRLYPENFGVYKDHEKQLLFFTDNTYYIPKEIKTIQYKGYM